MAKGVKEKTTSYNVQLYSIADLAFDGKICNMYMLADNSKGQCGNQINIYELISVCPYPGNVRMFLETTYSSQTKLIGLNLSIGEHGIGYSNLTPDPQGAWGGGLGGQNSSFTKSKNFANKSCQG